ncbi:hypothetical protein ABB07_04865 [Streptomyces incarnatus]|uniref:Uncharacterized protein n=1 Tax=Streptomyces incarnatus TaxID=665007 RepID=A0ABM5TEH6_9ACTN|nr:hypothetical protein ABB07_04865 [Streptomyces incarnatus]
MRSPRGLGSGWSRAGEGLGHDVRRYGRIARARGRYLRSGEGTGEADGIELLGAERDSSVGRPDTRSDMVPPGRLRAAAGGGRTEGRRQGSPRMLY